MERLTTYISEYKREMICRYEDCDTCEEYCPHLNEDNCPCLQEVLEKLAEYEDLEEIFRSKMTDAACEFLSDKEEFAKWLDRNKWIAKKCDEYARAEEQGKLLKPPCAVGDTVYVIPSKANYGINIVNGQKENNRVHEQIVDHIEIYRSGYLLSTCDGISSVTEEFYRVTWFLTKEEANTALEELARECKEMGYEIN